MTELEEIICDFIGWYVPENHYGKKNIEILEAFMNRKEPRDINKPVDVCKCEIKQIDRSKVGLWCKNCKKEIC